MLNLSLIVVYKPSFRLMFMYTHLWTTHEQTVNALNLTSNNSLPRYALKDYRVTLKHYQGFMTHEAM